MKCAYKSMQPSATYRGISGADPERQLKETIRAAVSLKRPAKDKRIEHGFVGRGRICRQALPGRAPAAVPRVGANPSRPASAAKLNYNCACTSAGTRAGHSLTTTLHELGTWDLGTVKQENEKTTSYAS